MESESTSPANEQPVSALSNGAGVGLPVHPEKSPHRSQALSNIFLTLPPELRTMIYRHALAVDDSQQIPGLFIVICTNKDLRERDYFEALRIYRELNVYVNGKTLNTLKAINLPRLLKFRSFQLVLPDEPSARLVVPIQN